jgi:hypothetical protein
MLRIEREEGWAPSTGGCCLLGFAPYGPRLGAPNPPADGDQRGEQSDCRKRLPLPVATLDHVEILRRIPGRVLDAGREDAATGVEKVHAQQVAIDRRCGDHRPADRHLRPRPIPLELQWDVDRGEEHGGNKDPTSRPWRAVSRDCAKPAQAVSSQMLMVSAAKMSVLNRYKPTSAAQPPPGLRRVPEAAASATTSAAIPSRMTVQRPTLKRQMSTRESSRRTAPGPSARRVTTNAEPSKATKTSRRRKGVA